MDAILACHPALSTEWLAGWQSLFHLNYDLSAQTPFGDQKRVLFCAYMFGVVVTESVTRKTCKKNHQVLYKRRCWRMVMKVFLDSFHVWTASSGCKKKQWFPDANDAARYEYSCLLSYQCNGHILTLSFFQVCQSVLLLCPQCSLVSLFWHAMFLVYTGRSGGDGGWWWACTGHADVAPAGSWYEVKWLDYCSVSTSSSVCTIAPLGTLSSHRTFSLYVHSPANISRCLSLFSSFLFLVFSKYISRGPSPGPQTLHWRRGFG